MKRLAYLDGSAGISGDMFLAACLDAGVPVDRLRAELERISLGAYEFKTSRVLRGGIAGTRVEVIVPGAQPERHLHDIEQLIGGSALGESVKQRALRMFARLAEVEGKLHGKSAHEVHFHEVGAVDAIVDIAGGAVALDLLGVTEFVSSPLNVGGGRVSAAHGSLPVPAPATAELLRGVPIYSSGVEAELVTPTGAVLVTTLAQSFGPMPPMKAESVGYGAGSRDLPGLPNLARLFVGEALADAGPQTRVPDGDAVAVIEANVDDMNPQLYGYLVDRALAAGALDITCASVQMKKNRPGLAISVMCPPHLAQTLADLLFRETTTIGVRIQEAQRVCLEREIVIVETPYGPVRVKVARRNGQVVNAAPEYEDCQRLAREKSVPLKQIMLAAQDAHSRR